MRLVFDDPSCDELLMPQKSVEPPVERDAKAEIMSRLFNATWRVTVARQTVPKALGHEQIRLCSDRQTEEEGKVGRDSKQLQVDRR
jgi:hypothetical protein